MFTPSLILISLGTMMVPGGVVGPDRVAVAFIGSGTLLVIAGVALGFAPVRWTELSLPGLKGEIESSDTDFKRFYRQHRERLHEFATLMIGDGAAAADALRAAAARTRLDWQFGAAEGPLVFMLRSLLKEFKRPGIALLLSGPAAARRWRGQTTREHRPEMLSALAELPFATRAAFLLDAFFSLTQAQIAQLTGLDEADVEQEVETVMEALEPVLATTAGGHDAGR